MMKYYLQSLGPGEHFIEIRGLQPSEVTPDSMVTTRLHLLIEAANICHQRSFRDYSFPGLNGRGSFTKYDMMVENVTFLFQDPFAHTMKLKKATGIMKQMMFSLAPPGRGKVIRWHPPLEKAAMTDFNEETVIDNDQATYDFVYEALVADFKLLAELQLFKLSDVFTYMISAEPNPLNMATASELSFIESTAGFFRGRAEPSHKAQVARVPPKPDVPAYKDDLKNNWYHTIKSIGDDLPSWEVFKENVLSAMTTKSSGGYSTTFDLLIDGEQVTYKANDKLLNFMNDPEKFLDPDLILTELTRDNPGKIFSREVVSRAMRAVFAVPLGMYLWETVFSGAILDLMADDPQFTLSKEQGRALADHKFGFYASSDPNHVIELKDFSQFDASQAWKNMRKYALAGAVKALEELGLDESWGPWEGGLVELLETLWEKFEAAVFKTGESIIVTDQVNSGENMTIILNNLTNVANYQSTLRHLYSKEESARVMDKMKLFKRFFMGDDSVEIYQTKSELTAQDMYILGNEIENAAKANGLDLNRFKTAIRKYFYEYLKKTGIYGYVIPRVLQIQQFASETTNFDQPIPDQLSGYYSLISESVSRGMNHDTSLTMCHFIGNLKSNLRLPGSRTKGTTTEFTRIPFPYLFTPIELGGVGQLPYSLVGASKDALCYLAYNVVQRERLNQCAFVLDVGQTEVKRSITNQVAEQLIEGKEYIARNLNPEKVMNALKSLNYLADNSIDIGDLGYTSTPFRLVKAAVADNPATEKIVGRFRGTQVRDYHRNSERLETYKTDFKLRVIVSPNFNLKHQLQRDVLRPQDCHYVVFGLSDTDDAVASGISRDEVVSKYTSVINASGKEPYLYLTYEEYNQVGVFLRETAHADVIHIYTDQDIEEVREDLIFSENSYAYHESDDPYSFSSWALRTFPRRTVKTVPDAMRKMYGWLDPFLFEDREEIERKLNTNPIAGLDPYLDVMCMQLGVSSSGDDLAVKVNTLLNKLSRDRGWPHDLRPEVVFNMITKPNISINSRHVENVLIAMGAKPAIAAEIATSLQKLVGKFTFTQQTTSYSSADQIIGYLDLGVKNYEDNISIDPLDDVMLQQVIKGLGMLHLVTQPPNRPRRKVHIHILGNQLIPARRALMGSIFDDVLLFEKTYPNNFLHGF
jgi:hypothetical protein